MKEVISKLLKKALKEEKVDLDEKEIEKFIEVPPSSDLGDYAFPCFFLRDKIKEEPAQIAIMLRENLEKSMAGFDDIQTSGPFINFFVDRKKLAINLIKEIILKKERFGKSKIGKQNRTMIEFSQPNTHKAFHVGHIRGTSLGESLARILEFCGEKVIRANYSGDTGMHVAKWLWCYSNYHVREKIKNDESWIASIYVDAVRRLAKYKTLQKKVDEINKELMLGNNKTLNSLWKKTRKMSLNSFEKIYKQLNTQFDVHFFESEMEKRGGEIVDELLKKKIARISDDAVIMNLKKYKLGIWVLLRKDKTPLYSIKDLALAEEKFKKYKINKNIYVVGAAQSLHINQLFKTLELMGFSKSIQNKFIPFSEVRLPHGKMSSRTGENILYSEFLQEIIDYSKKEIKIRFPSISKEKLEKRASKISIAAIKYFMLKQNQNKNIIFRKQDALNFEGDSGAYLLYSYARANSILKKAYKKTKQKLIISELDTKEVELIKKFSQFPEVVLNSYENMNCALIANYSYKLAQSFNEFYQACPVINSEQEAFRISVVEAFKQVMDNALNLLGIDVIDEM